MRTIFSARTRASTWRQLSIWLAEAEQELGLDISDEAIAQMKANVTITDHEFEQVAEVEKKCRHDIMSYIQIFGQAAPAADGIIHWGAISCYCTGMHFSEFSHFPCGELTHQFSFLSGPARPGGVRLLRDIQTNQLDP